MKKCPYCAEEIQDEEIVCRYCNRDLPKQVAEVKPVIEAKPVAEVKVKKPWNVFWRALAFGIGISYFATRYYVSSFVSAYGLVPSDASFRLFSGILIYAGIYAFVVWIKRAFVKHEPGVPRFSKNTGFVSVMLFILGLILEITFSVIMSLGS